MTQTENQATKRSLADLVGSAGTAGVQEVERAVAAAPTPAPKPAPAPVATETAAEEAAAEAAAEEKRLEDESLREIAARLYPYLESKVVDTVRRFS